MHEIINMDELEAFLGDCGDKIVVIDFWAGWCGPCKLVGPVFERLSRDPSLTEKMAFVKVDVDEATDIAEWIGVECMPMFVFYQNGEKSFMQGTSLQSCIIIGPVVAEMSFEGNGGQMYDRPRTECDPNSSLWQMCQIDEFAGANGKLLEEKIREYAQNS